MQTNNQQLTETSMTLYDCLENHAILFWRKSRNVFPFSYSKILDFRGNLYEIREKHSLEPGACSLEIRPYAPTTEDIVSDDWIGISK